MTWDWHETIVAPASAAGGAARGVVRASGQQVPQLIATCFRPLEPARGRGSDRSPRGPHVVDGVFRADPPLGEVPCRLLVWPTSRSYTRQLAAEFHLPGSPPILSAAVDALCRAGARLAGPGEFTLRAFLAGRLDLTRAEAVLGVIQAESQRELVVALEQLAGGLAGPLDALRDRLLDLLAHLEAGLDFVDEDLDFLDRRELIDQLGQAELRVRQLVERLPARSRREAEMRVVLRGLPNAGKSSLLNALAGEARALVSDQEGTTRDYVRGAMDLDGLLVHLIDTAGAVPLVAAGIPEAARRATSNQLAQAHLELLCLDGSRPRSDWELAELAEIPPHPRIVVVTKQDLMPEEGDDVGEAERSGPRAAADGTSAWPSGTGGTIEDARRRPGVEAVHVSSWTGYGLAELRRAIRQKLVASPGGDAEVVQGTAARCQESLWGALESLQHALSAAQEDQGEELIAAELRLALDELGRVVGAVYSDDVLDRIFSRFCIGK